MVRGVLWARLDRDRPADRAAHERSFGRENTGVIYGWIGASHQLGASMAAFGAGAIRTAAGDYRLAFWMAGALCMLAGTSFLTVGRRALRPAVATA